MSKPYIVNSEFRDLAPPLNEEELFKLQESIEEEGLRDKLVVWKETKELLDGHHRDAVCDVLNIVISERSIKSLSFESKEKATNWCIANHLGRRNITPEFASYLRGLRYEREKKRHGERGKSKTKLLETKEKKTLENQESFETETRKRLAKEYQISPSTIEADAKFYCCLTDLTKDLSSKFRKEVLGRAQSGTKQKYTKTDVNKRLFNKTTEERHKIVEMLDFGDAKNVGDACRLLAREKVKGQKFKKGKYRVIYADPPWDYGGTLPKKEYGHVEYHYPPMSIEELCEMSIPRTEDNAVLFLWVTSPFLRKCFEVIKAWGFQYKTSVVWLKKKHNFGQYVSVRHELLLICTKGSCRPDISKLLPSYVEVERSKVHSEKPECFREYPDKMYPYGNRIELFARKKVKGWDSWGDEA